jgi:hypothetical protein
MFILKYTPCICEVIKKLTGDMPFYVTQRNNDKLNTGNKICSCQRNTCLWLKINQQNIIKHKY